MGSLSNILSAVQNGVIAVNNLGRQVNGSFINIQSRFVADETNIATNTANIATLQANAFLRGLLAGLTLSTAGGSSTFSIATGSAADTAAFAIMNLASAYTKTTGAWAVGTGNGALDTGAIANATWYHVFLIERPDTGVVDIAVSLSASAPTTGGNIPAAYTLSRRIGSMRTDGSAHWVAFLQFSDLFLWIAPVSNASAVNSVVANTLVTLTVPTGVRVQAKFTFVSVFIANLVAFEISPPDVSYSVNPAGVLGFYSSIVPIANTQAAEDMTVLVDTSARVNIATSGTGAQYYIGTYGWIDERGKNA